VGSNEGRKSRSLLPIFFLSNLFSTCTVERLQGLAQVEIYLYFIFALKTSCFFVENKLFLPRKQVVFVSKTK